LNRTTERHEALRTTLKTKGDDLFQCIREEHRIFSVRKIDLRNADIGEENLSKHIADEIGVAFDLERGPLARACLIQLGTEDHVLIIVMHHIITDGWSWNVFTKELGRYYDARCREEEVSLAPLLVQYVDYAAWQRSRLTGDVSAKQAAYWQKALSGAPPLLELPADRDRPARQDFRGDSVDVELGEDLAAALRAFSRHHEVTVFVTILATWALILSRLSKQSDVVIGVPIANRSRLEFEGVIGFFVNTLALRIDLSGNPTFEELLIRVKERVAEANAYQDFPFERIVDLIKPARSLARTPIFQVMFGWQSSEREILKLSSLFVREISGEKKTAQCDLALELEEVDARIGGNLTYAIALFDRETVTRYARALFTALASIIANVQQAIGTIPIASDQAGTSGTLR
jgi:hypothetical protein